METQTADPPVRESFRPADLPWEGCLIIDFEGKYIYVNEAAARQRNRTPEDMLGFHVAEVFPRAVSSKAWPKGVLCLKEGIPQRDIFSYPGPDGGTIWLDIYTEPVPEGIRFWSTDITDRMGPEATASRQGMDCRPPFRTLTEAYQAMEASENRYRSLFETMSEGFALQEIVLDDRGEPCDSRFLDVNTAFERLTGFFQGDVLGRKASESVPPGPLWGPQFGTLATPGQFIHQEAFWPLVGKHFDIFAYTPLPGQFAVLFMDITLRKETEKAVLELNRTLEARSLEMRAALEELDSFSYSVSHDLRAPLRHINGFTKLLMKELGGGAGEKAAHYLETIHASTTQMGNLIDALLSFSQSGRATLQKQGVDLERLVRDIIEGMEPETRERRVNWHVDPLPVIAADPVLIRSVLENLLSNALKFTRPRPEARIRIGSENLDQETVISVSDNGTGFNPRHANRLFGVFQRLHSSTQFEGSGIGLANVRRIITRHGGRTWATGIPDGGATFSFSLPRA